LVTAPAACSERRRLLFTSGNSRSLFVQALALAMSANARCAVEQGRAGAYTALRGPIGVTPRFSISQIVSIKPRALPECPLESDLPAATIIAASSAVERRAVLLDPIASRRSTRSNARWWIALVAEMRVLRTSHGVLANSPTSALLCRPDSRVAINLVPHMPEGLGAPRSPLKLAL